MNKQGQGLSIKQIKHICDLIGKKGKDGEAITEEEIQEWDSVQQDKKEQKS